MGIGSKKFKSIAKRAIARAGYVVRHRPRLLAERPEDELVVDPSFILAHLLAHMPTAYVVQVGAFDGRANDPLNFFVRKFKLHCLLVEPQATAFEQLRQTYADQSQVVLCRTAIAERDGIRDLFRVDPDIPGLPAWVPQIASFHREVVMSHAHAIPGLDRFIIAESVPCTRFQTLFSQNRVAQVDILQVDTEGYDYEVLKLFPFDQFTPAFIRYEHSHLSDIDRDACMRMLLNRGYKLHVPFGNQPDYTDTVAYRPPEKGTIPANGTI